jgi:hypothetical protein
MSLRRPRKVNIFFGVRQWGHGHEPMFLIVVINVNDEAKDKVSASKRELL